MKALIVSVLALFAAPSIVSPAAAQEVRAGASIRLSDDVVIGLAYGRPDAYRHLERYELYRGYLRRGPVRRVRNRGWWIALEREHARVMRDGRRGIITPRAHLRWHVVVGVGHGAFRDDHLRRDRGRHAGWGGDSPRRPRAGPARGRNR